MQIAELMQHFNTVFQKGDSAAMNFVCSELPSAVFQKLYEQKKSGRFCDITLFVNSRIIKAHRNVLACSSPYFDSILKQHKVAKEQLTVACSNSEIFDSIINYMYTGELTINHSNVEEMLKLADHFIITKIIEYCIEFLGTKLNLENCLFTYFLTLRFKLKHLGNIVENWIGSHLDEICKGNEIISLNSQELQEFFKNKSFSLSTAKALLVLSQWVLTDVEKREKDFDKLIKCFQTHTLEPVEVFKHLDTCILYNKSELCIYRFLDYLFQNNWMLSNFKARYDSLHVKYGQMPLSSDRQSGTDSKLEKITVTERTESNTTTTQNTFTSVIVRTKIKNRKQLILKRLMLFGLKPSLRMAALKMLTCKKKKFTLSELENETDADDEDEKIRIKCPLCFVAINDSFLLEQHLALSHSKDVTYKCGLCTFVCQYHGDYLNHMKTHFPGPPFKCDYCDTTSDQISKLVAHRAQHLDESIFQCTFCSFKCRQKQNFVSHLKIHAPEKTFKCDSCTKTFRFKQNLESHMLTHTSSDKNLTCDSCGFHTKFLSHMIAHKRIHAGDIYRCSYLHCKYSTSKKNQLASHAKSHNGVRPHSCNVCGRGFMEKSHLVRHERIHLEEKPFKCSNCDYASSRRDKLKEHFTRHHGENASAKVPYKARPMRNNPTATRPKSQSTQEAVITTSASANSNGINFTQTTSTTSSGISQPLNNDIQDLIMHHQTHQSVTSATANNLANNLTALNTNYHHFADPTEFHHHNHTHNIHNQLLASTGHNQRSAQHHNNNLVNHHMLARTNHSTATSTAAAVAAAMMLDPRFHHNSTVPYHPTTAPVSMAMAAVQTSQQIQASAQHSDYPPSLQNCMTLF